ncbi:LysR family transcriptional regulator [Cohnella cellulosilytica]|uniref:LysR family transcriptional regulator n=1 Tax=Cohnella cellulosilytica TaxID=986710 RepID=A0ABW2F8H4_9BACL
MSLLKLKIVELLDRYKQVTAVADALHMKQPTISFHMKRMESDWGVKLFETRAGRIYLTEAGKTLLPYARRIAALHAEAEAAVGELRDNGRRLLRIGCTDCAMAALAGTGWLAEIGRIPDIRVNVAKENDDDLFRRLESGDLDLAIGGWQPVDPERLRSAELLVSPWKLLLPANHPLDGLSGPALAERLHRYPFVEHAERSLGELVSPWLARMGVSRVNVSFDSVELIAQAVRDGLGLAVLPERALPASAPRAVAADWPDRPESWTLYASWHVREGYGELAERIVRTLFP